MGIRHPMPKKDWVSPLNDVEFCHTKPFESAFYGKAEAPFVISNRFPDCYGQYKERRRNGVSIVTREHAERALEKLRLSPHRPTEWAKQVHAIEPSHSLPRRSSHARIPTCSSQELESLQIFPRHPGQWTASARGFASVLAARPPRAA